MASDTALKDCEVILGNSNNRFSGVTSTMLQTLKYQQREMSVLVLGKHHLPPSLAHLAISFGEASRILKRPRSDGKWRVFHARRNDEMIQALILKWLFGARIKIIFTSTAQRMHSSFTRWLMSKMDGVLSTCHAAARYLEKQPARIVPHGVDTDLYRPKDIKKSQHTIEQNTLKIGMFGRVREQKGCHLLVRACIETFPRHPNASAHIVGAISPEHHSWVESLKSEIDDAGLSSRIIFLGEQTFDALPELFRQCDIVAALSRTEGFGLTVLEAMSSGAAILATEAGAWPEIVNQSEHGWVVPINNQIEINNKLKTLLSQPEHTRAMGAAGREHVVKHYKIQDEARKLCEYYREVSQS